MIDVPVDVAHGTVDALEDLVAVLPAGVDITEPLSVRPIVAFHDASGVELGRANTQGVRVQVWADGTYEPVEPEAVELPAALRQHLPERIGVLATMRAVPAKVAEPSVPAVVMDNADKAQDHLPAVIGNVDMERELPSVERIEELLGTWDGFTSAQEIYDLLVQAKERHAALVSELQTEVAQ